jgi:hypothetical protein
MKISNRIWVAFAFAIALAATLTEKLFANQLANNTLYALSSMTGNCVVADEDDLADGCVVSATGTVCRVYIVENGMTQYAPAYRSLSPLPFCTQTVKRPI